MKNLSKLAALMMLAFGMISCSNSVVISGNGGNGTENPSVTYIGTKAPTEAKAVGDIVFNDGSAMPYSAFDALSDEEKNAKKASAIALIFYKGTGLNSGDDTTTSHTLGVGLKHNSSEGLAWCLESANAYSKKITIIECSSSGIGDATTFTGDRNGSDNLEQIAAFLSAEGSETTDDTTGEEASDRYPAFYYAKNYSSTASNLGETYKDGWYLPSIAELFQIYACRADTSNGFDIDAASQALGGDKFDTSVYWSSSQFVSNISDYDSLAYGLNFQLGWCPNYFKNNKNNIKMSVCCIRAFN